MKPYITTQNLSVEFPIYNSNHRSLKQSLINFSTGGRLAKGSNDRVVIRALNNINLDIKSGDRIGLVGHNGSGKTTLLRVLAGVYAPTQGNIKRHGSTASLVDLNLGMDQEATGYENIRIRGLLLGLSISEIDALTDEIANFSELGDFLNVPVRTYSSGMMMRLGFAISTCIHSDIIIMDEWLSVGDANFQEKAAKKLNQLVNDASILILASHNINLIKKTCNRIVDMKKGEVIDIKDNVLPS